MILKIDLDSLRERKVFRQRWPKVKRWLAKAGVQFGYLKCRRSPSGRGWHYTARMVINEELWDTARWVPSGSEALVECAVQAILGSDWRREALYLMRILAPGAPDFWRRRSNILFTHKLKGKKGGKR